MRRFRGMLAVLPGPWRLALVVLGIVVVAEAAALAVLHALVPDVHTIVLSLKGTALLVLLCMPVLWWVAVRPLGNAAMAEQARAATLVGCASDGIITVDDRGAVETLNPAGARMFGREEVEVVGQPVTLLLPRRDLSRLRGELRELDRGRSPPRSAEGGKTLRTHGVRKDGSEFPIELSLAVWKRGARTLYTAIIRDVTERERMEVVRALLRDIDHRILCHERLDGVLQFACERIVEVFGCESTWIGVKGADGSIKVRAHAGLASDCQEGDVLRWGGHLGGEGPVARAVRTGAPESGELVNEERGANSTQAGCGTRHFWAIPLVAEGQALGVIGLHGGRSELNRDDLGHLVSFANHLAISFTQAQHLDRIRLQTAALEAAANSVVITDRGGNIQWVNPAFTHLTGYQPEEVLGKKPSVLKSGKQDVAFYRRMWEAILAGQVWKGELHNRKKDGSLYLDEQVITPVINEGGEITHFVAIKEDITERRRQEEQVRHLAMHDPLTDLPNRRLLEVNLDRAVSRAQRGHLGGLLFIDLDNFKVVNDTLGHHAGDLFLLGVVRVLGASLRDGDVLARVGGDEFAVLLEDMPLEEAGAVAERLRREVDEFRFAEDGQSFGASVSIGLAPIDGLLPGAAVLAQADAAMYAGKEAGGNQVMLYRPEDEHSRPGVAGQWVTRIKDALREDQFLLHFQPVVHVPSGQAKQFEALLRLRDRGRIIAPGAFLPAAERFGLMPRLDHWVVERALQVACAHPDLGLFVNLSGAGLQQDSLLELIEQRLRQCREICGHIVFEITETVAIRDVVRVQRWMKVCRELGCRFALDDFGTGFCSFSYLRSLPVDYLKIDGAFTRGLSTDAGHRAIVKAMSQVAQATGKLVIAEHVENADTAQIVRELGVDYGQGFYWGMPGSEDEILRTDRAVRESRGTHASQVLNER